jgi:hypothetical protein
LKEVGVFARSHLAVEDLECGRLGVYPEEFLWAIDTSMPRHLPIFGDPPVGSGVDHHVSGLAGFGDHLFPTIMDLRDFCRTLCIWSMHKCSTRCRDDDFLISHIRYHAHHGKNRALAGRSVFDEVMTNFGQIYAANTGTDGGCGAVLRKRRDGKGGHQAA